MSEQCTTAYNNALKEAAKTAPKYATREDCVAEFGEAQCTVRRLRRRPAWRRNRKAAAASGCR